MDLYVDICSGVSDDCETEILNIDSYIPTTSSHKQSQSCPLVLTSKSETGTVRGRMYIALMPKEASKHKMQGGYSKYGSCKNSSHFSAQSKKCHLMKPRTHGGVELGHTIQGHKQIWSADENSVQVSIGLHR